MIKKILSNTMLSIFMDKSAKKNFFAVQESRKINNKENINVQPTKDTKLPVASMAGAHTQNVRREALIRNAVAVHKEYSKVFDNLSKDQKQRLQLLAMQAMFGKSRKSNRAKSKSTNLPPTTDTKTPIASVAGAHTPNVRRETLIRNAMAVHKEYSKVFDNLSEDQKQRLQILAQHTMLGKIKK
jgi:uncharacterized protein with von Willebrand factor type A (vWA) domain